MATRREETEMSETGGHDEVREREDDARRARTESEAERANAERESERPEAEREDDGVIPSAADEQRRGVIPPPTGT
jgi:F0F1-type ATP synthase membrane subunit b/b'